MKVIVKHKKTDTISTFLVADISEIDKREYFILLIVEKIYYKNLNL